ncbi:MAG: hypothetical protein H6749_00135 [Nitrospiraceae bacterium]|nr:hypothetical protein [Nitrospiraceae bacterium]
MSISQELMYAILAMDSYDREYNPGILLSGSNIGTASIGSEELLPAASQSAGFYAVAYQWNDDSIISYRGTDNPGLWADDIAGGSDVWNGYGLGVGSPYAEQGRLAAEFYQAVTGTQISDPLAESATLTGHPLGGGLAGLIGALYHEDAVLFDNMPFELAATSVCEHANFGDAVWQPLRDPLSNGLSPWAPLIARHFQAGSAVTGECLAAFRGLQHTPVT